MTEIVDWVAVDWGTSNLRAWGIGPGGAVAFEKSSPKGMGKLTREEFPGALAELLEGVAPANNNLSAWARVTFRMRLPMKPSQMPARTGILASRRASAKPVARTSCAVVAVGTISKSFITFAGLKKCSPRKRFGWLTPWLIASGSR